MDSNAEVVSAAHRFSRMWQKVKSQGWYIGRLVVCLLLVCFVPMSYRELLHISQLALQRPEAQYSPNKTFSFDITAPLNNITESVFENKSLQIGMWWYDP